MGEFDSYSIARMEQYATKSRLYNYDYFISINSSLPKNENNIFTDVYTCGNTSHENFLQPDSESNFGGVEVIVTMLENECAGIIFSSKDLTIFICANQKFTEGMYLQFSLTYGDFDLVMGEDIYLNPYLNYINYDYCISSGANILQFGELRQNVSMQNWTFNLGNSKLYNIRGVD